MLARSLKPRGYDVRIIARRKEPVDPSEPETQFLGRYIAATWLSNLMFAIHVGWRVLWTRADLIHSHGAYYYGWTSIVVAKLRGLPSVLKVTLVGGDDPKSVASLRQFGLPVGRVVQGQFRAASRVIAMSREIADLVRTDAPGSAVSIVPNGVRLPDLTLARQSPREVEQDYILFVGKVGRRKGADVLADAFARIQDDVPLDLVFVGPVDADVERTLASLDESVRAKIHCLGARAHDDVESLLAHASVFALPSQAEGLPNALLEALAYGVPAVVSDIEVHREICGDSVLYAPVGDAAALAEGLRAAALEQDRWASSARECVAPYGIDMVASAYADLYRELGVPNA